MIQNSVSVRSRTGHQMPKRTYFQDCRQVLRKNHENRQVSENQLLIKLVDKVTLLREARDIFGLEFAKDLLKNAKIEFVEQRQMIVEEQQPLSYCIIVLQGRLAIQRSQFDQDYAKQQQIGKAQDPKVQEIKTEQILERLTVLATRYRDQQKKTNKLQRKSSLPVSEYEFYLPLLTEAQYIVNCERILKYLTANQQFGMKQRLANDSYKNRVIAVQKSTILIFEMNFVFYELQVIAKARINKTIKRLRQIPAFNILEDEKLSQVIIRLKLVKPRKNDVVYRQGDASINLFVLLQGQIKLTKQVNLFMQNPNDLYVDRRTLIRQLNQNQKRPASKAQPKFVDVNEGVLPFANLTTLYNYRPSKKIVDIAAVTQFGLFGEQQLIFGGRRETTAYVNSLNTTYYQIKFDDMLQILGPKYSQGFRETLQKSIKGKVLYRQKELAAHIHFQNTTNLNYFFLDDPKTKDNPRKFKLKKINELIKAKTARDNASHAPPFYTAANFNKMLERRRYTSQTNKSAPRSKAADSTLSTEQLKVEQFNQAEEKVLGFSHSWSPIEKKVNKQKLVSGMISPFKHRINIREPLIDQQFFVSKDLETKRINRQFRTVRLSFAKKNKELS